MSTSAPQKRHAVHTLDIDSYLNRIIPRPRFDLLPRPVSYWFGYRAPKQSQPNSRSQSTSILFNWLFSFLGAFIGIAIIENVFRALPLLGGRPAPIVIASFGAAAILEYNAVESPLSQPRNMIFGHFISAVIAVSITKLFHLLPEAQFEELRWLAGALAVGAASTSMSMTKTIHPPAGATALLAATTPQITELGWWLLPLVLLACSLMLASAMLVNNMYKRWPLFWWTSTDLSRLGKPDAVEEKDVEKGGGEVNLGSQNSIDSASDAGLKRNVQGSWERAGSDATAVSHHEGEDYDTVDKKRARNIHDSPDLKLQIEIDMIAVPEWVSLSQREVEVLEEIQTRLRQGGSAK